MKKEKNTDWIYYVFVFLSAIAVFTYILHVGYISSGSMEPALMTHDVTVSSRIIISPIKCGDIISFKRENGDIYGKRVIGVAGDEVMIIGGHVYINGEKLEEAYIAGDVKTHASESTKYEFPSLVGITFNVSRSGSPPFSMIFLPRRTTAPPRRP